jgi:hypothetical protein
MVSQYLVVYLRKSVDRHNMLYILLTMETKKLYLELRWNPRERKPRGYWKEFFEGIKVPYRAVLTSMVEANQFTTGCGLYRPDLCVARKSLGDGRFAVLVRTKSEVESQFSNG